MKFKIFNKIIKMKIVNQIILIDNLFYRKNDFKTCNMKKENDGVI